MSRTVAPAAAAVAARAAQRGDTKVNEQSHLAPCYRDTLRAITAGTSYRPALPGERVLGDCAQWPRVGDVDALVAGPGGPGWVELKLHSGVETLCPCAWDTAKLAVALILGRATRAYMLAGTTADNWAAGIRGAELFGPRRVETSESLRHRFADWWEYWERRSDPLPLVMATSFATELITSAAFTVAGGADYELRLARVTVVDARAYPWPPFLRPQDRAQKRSTSSAD